MFKYTLTCKSEICEATHKVNDLDAALNLYITSYESEVFDTVVLVKSETGEVMASFDKAKHDLWQSDEVTVHMVRTICAEGSLEDAFGLVDLLFGS